MRERNRCSMMPKKRDDEQEKFSFHILRSSSTLWGPFEVHLKWTILSPVSLVTDSIKYLWLLVVTVILFYTCTAAQHWLYQDCTFRKSHWTLVQLQILLRCITDVTFILQTLLNFKSGYGRKLCRTSWRAGTVLMKLNNRLLLKREQKYSCRHKFRSWSRMERRTSIVCVTLNCSQL